ncbi:YibE/F family protein [Jiangella aurantiaca]|uniref:YibE/F family protein n=1 Tax=Jiangella aurantiaca TaxID=2530373 RepID=A0A4R5AGI0_9ACTN|nr:YibE/F family protein [Jiangella aurantiaca]TDD70024.1 YibE/F family protein [Jiangella aurantiaca]
MSAVHLHGTEPAPPAGPHVRRLVLAVLIPLVLATIAGLILLWPDGDPPSIEAGVRTDGTILAIEPCEDVVEAPPTPEGEDTAGECLQARVRVDAGPDEGVETVVPLPFGIGAPEFHEGDEVVLSALPDAPLESRYEVLDFQRDAPLLWLAGLFAVAVVVLSGWKGLAALGGLAVSLVVLLVFVLPALLTGESPLPVAVVGASLIMMVTLYLAHGLSVRTSVALIGTLVSLTLTGLLGSLFTSVAHFTGLAGDAASYLGTVNTEIDVRGLLLAGLVIGALGVLDDVTVTQSAAVWELAAADPSSSRRSLLGAGLRIGREHVAATVNTLVLAYVGAALPLLMLFSVAGQGVTDVITTEAVAQEIVRALVGGLGIIAAVPVTTALAVLAVRGRPARPAGRRRKPVSSTLEP